MSFRINKEHPSFIINLASDVYGKSATKKDKGSEFTLEFSQDTMEDKVIDSITAIKNGAKLETEVMESGGTVKQSSSLHAITEGPKSRLTWTSFHSVCVCHSALRMPKMSQVIQALEGYISLSDLDEGIKPGHNSAYNGSSDYDTAQYNVNMAKFRKPAGIYVFGYAFANGEIVSNAVSQHTHLLIANMIQPEDGLPARPNKQS
ncbi:hypothetical protein Tco_0701404 [Tanacetum coccineum]